MTDNIVGLDEAVSIALRLSAADRLRLIERVVSSVEHDLESSASEEEQPDVHWGQALNQLLNTLEPIEFVAPEVEDPVEWVKLQREGNARNG